MKKVGIRAVLFLLVTLPLVGVLGSGLIVLQALEQRIEDRLKEDIELIARTLQAPMSRSLQRRSDRELDLALWSAYGTGRVYGVYVYDEDGALVAGADRDHTGPAAPQRAVRGEIVEAGGEYGSLAGREMYSYFVPLYATTGQVIGLLQVTRDASEMRGYLRRLRSTGFWLLVFAVGILGTLVFVGHYLVVGRPLQSLEAVMERVGAGQADVRAAERGPAELRQLASHFNQMLVALHEKDADIAMKRADQERLEVRLRESEKYAMVGRLASGVAHELGTPLAVIDAHAQKLSRSARSGSAEAQVAAGIRDAVTRMSAVIRQLLGFGRASHAARNDVSLRQLVILAATDMGERCRVDGAALEIDGPAEDCVLRQADAGRLREALGHLVRNACHAAAGGKVLVGWRQRDGEPALFVEDSGPGIDDLSRGMIFDPFYTTKAPGEGSGLGLAIVRGIAADHQAELTVYRSERLGGAGFELRFRRDA